jgi:predicted NUDIX family phosphoesterase
MGTNKDDEVVLCVHRDRLIELFGEFSGYMPLENADRLYHGLLQADRVCWLRRGDCETDPNYKQIIPYVVVVHRGFGDEMVYRYTRAKPAQGGEERLFGQHSIGLGGHVNPLVGDAENGHDAGFCFDESIARELHEEVRMDTSIAWRPIGLVNHDETLLGEVHVGVVVLAEVAAPAVYPAEDAIYGGYFAPLRHLKRDRLIAQDDPDSAAATGAANFERWSEILLDSEMFGPAETWRYDVIVEVRGGVVQAAYARDGTLDVEVLDWDDYEALPDADDVAVLRKMVLADRTPEDNELIHMGERRQEIEQLDDIAREFFTTIY